VLLILLAVDSFLGRVDGIILLLGFAVFMAYTLMQAKTGSTDEVQAETSPVWKNIVYLVGGLLGLVLGSNLFVDSASSVAYALDISEGVVGLTVVAGGTSLPELATSVVAARKGQSAIAIGNVIGSNVFNILLILGLTATISPMEIEGITTIDMAVMLISVALVWMFSFTRYTVERWEGAVLVGGYLVYLCWLISSL
jgi:cation:H+ antiporter